MYSFMPLRSVLKHIPEMERLGVGEVARSQGGFIPAYKRAKYAGNIPDKWLLKRAAFIGRRLVLYNISPSYRRWLNLVAWAYKPKKRPRT